MRWGIIVNLDLRGQTLWIFGEQVDKFHFATSNYDADDTVIIQQYWIRVKLKIDLSLILSGNIDVI